MILTVNGNLSEIDTLQSEGVLLRKLLFENLSMPLSHGESPPLADQVIVHVFHHFCISFLLTHLCVGYLQEQLAQVRAQAEQEAAAQQQYITELDQRLDEVTKSEKALREEAAQREQDFEQLSARAAATERALQEKVDMLEGENKRMENLLAQGQAASSSSAVRCAAMRDAVAGVSREIVMQNEFPIC